MNTIDILKQARELIKEPKHWIKDAFAQDEHGNMFSTDSSHATCFCAAGAIYHVIGANDVADEVIELLEKAIPKSAADSNGHQILDVATYNDEDTTTHADVLALFDRAIQGT